VKPKESYSILRDVHTSVSANNFDRALAVAILDLLKRVNKLELIAKALEKEWEWLADDESGDL
jgi:tetrahydromethanopterin S-methyltransferase subunit B